MGFFEDTKPPEPPPVVIQQVKKDWLETLIAGIFAILLLLLTGILRSLTLILKPVFVYLFTFDGRTREQIIKQMVIACILILVPLFLLYRIPAVQDFISLSATHTINHTANGQRIAFPDRSHFVQTDRQIAHAFAGKTYITYAGYTKQNMQKTSAGYCHMVTRSKRLGLASIHPPIQAEGFEDKVTYTMRSRISELTGLVYFFYYMSNLKLSKEDLDSTFVESETTSSWKEFIDNWDKIWSPPSFHGHTPFEVKALAEEHAIVCF